MTPDPIIKSPSTDPAGRGKEGFIGWVVGAGWFILFRLALVAGWMTWLGTNRLNWYFDFLVGGTTFIQLAPIVAANYLSNHTLVAREYQRLLNLALVAGAAASLPVLQKNLSRAKSIYGRVLGSIVLALVIYGLVAIQYGYSCLMNYRASV